MNQYLVNYDMGIFEYLYRLIKTEGTKCAQK